MVKRQNAPTRKLVVMYSLFLPLSRLNCRLHEARELRALRLGKLGPGSELTEFILFHDSPRLMKGTPHEHWAVGIYPQAILSFRNDLEHTIRHSSCRPLVAANLQTMRSLSSQCPDLSSLGSQGRLEAESRPGARIGLGVRQGSEICRKAAGGWSGR